MSPEEATAKETEPETKAEETAKIEVTSLEEIFSLDVPNPERDVKTLEPEVKSEAKEPEKEEKSETESTPEDKKEEAKKEEEPEKDKEEAKTGWESDDNPYKKQFEESKEKEKSQRNWNTELKREVTDLQQKSVITDKKLDGSYDPEVDDAPKETPEQLQSRGDLQGRISASTEIANDKYGEAEVTKILNKFQDDFSQNQAIQTRMLMSNTPVMEAIKIVEEQAFFDKYGSNPDAIRDKIREEHEKEMTERITKEVTAQLTERLSKKNGAVNGLADVPNSSENEKNKPGVESLESIFAL